MTLTINYGQPLPYGASRHPDGVNFSLASRHATAVWVVIFEPGADKPLAELPLQHRIGDVFCGLVEGLDTDEFEYGFRVDGPWNPRRGHRFDSSLVLLDPYARALSGRSQWGDRRSPPAPLRSRLVSSDFDWEGVESPGLAAEELVIYELHVRGFTRGDSELGDLAGTYAGVIEKIPYLQALGVNAVELMPIFEFDELDNPRKNPEDGQLLLNFWGYSTLGFFAPKAGFAADPANHITELKTLVRELHRAGIEVILDVVFNHTGEGNDLGPTLTFRGIDNATYYLLAADGTYLNYSGTGNTMNCNHPVVRSMVMDCLRYWVSEYKIDGFRFDLAAILGRGPHGEPLDNPPLLEAIAYDPVLAKCKLIAEAWDAGGLYMVGQFPAHNRWAEWNGRYRDTLRRFLKGDAGQVQDVSLRLSGSPDLYGHRGTTASINFVTCHDGFTLRDLFSYDHKHNLANGEANRDGSDHNDSWNHGVEGPSEDPAIIELRERQIRNALTLLMVSRGIPMFLMGDEVGRTQGGNNNPYCHDSEVAWFDWADPERAPELFAFTQSLIAFRKAHPCLRSLGPVTAAGAGPSPFMSDVTFHGRRARSPELGHESRALGMLIRGWGDPSVSTVPGPWSDFVYVAINMGSEPFTFELPELPESLAWRVAIRTDAQPSERQHGERVVHAPPRTVIILTGD